MVVITKYFFVNILIEYSKNCYIKSLIYTINIFIKMVKCFSIFYYLFI